MLGFHAISEAPVSSETALTTLTESQPAFGLGPQGLLSSQPAFGPGKLTLSGSQAGYGLGKLVLSGSLPGFALGPLQAMSGSVPVFARSSPDLPVTTNVVQQRYAPSHLIEITV